jgi:hypothetical protein
VRTAVAAVFLLGLSLAAVSPPHVLEASGSHGWLKFWGDGTAMLSGRGTLTIQNASRQQIEMKGTWEKVDKLPDGATYWSFNGSVHTIGIGAHLELRGWDLSLQAKGPWGKAWFRGEGTVALDGAQAQPWVDHPDKWLKVKY